MWCPTQIISHMVAICVCRCVVRVVGGQYGCGVSVRGVGVVGY